MSAHIHAKSLRVFNNTSLTFRASMQLAVGKTIDLGYIEVGQFADTGRLTESLMYTLHVDAGKVHKVLETYINDGFSEQIEIHITNIMLGTARSI